MSEEIAMLVFFRELRSYPESDIILSGEISPPGLKERSRKLLRQDLQFVRHGSSGSDGKKTLQRSGLRELSFAR